MNILETIIILVQMIFIARFHFELSEVNGYIEPVNTIRKITNPLVMPIKRFLPSPTAKKLTAIAVAYLLSVAILIVAIVALNGELTQVLWVAFIRLLLTWITFLQYAIIMFVIMSWVIMLSGGGNTNPLLARSGYLLEKILQPLLQPIQRVIPALGGFDFSPIVLWFALSFLASWIYSLVGKLG